MLYCPLLPIEGSGLLQKHFLHIFWANISHVNASVAFEYQGVSMRPRFTQITGLTHHRSCRSSHLSPRPDPKDLLQPCFFLFRVPFSRPRLFCPSLSSHSREIFFHFKAESFHEERQRRSYNFLSTADAICLLNFLSFSGSYLHCMNSPRSCWHQNPLVTNKFLTPTFM